MKVRLKGDKFNTENNSVLFVTTQLRPRELKMASALQSIGWAVDLIYCDTTPFSPQGYFRSIFKVNSSVEAHDAARLFQPKVIHIFSGAIDEYVLLFCSKKIAPTVVDLNDIFSSSLFDYCHERFDLTKKALKMADGFCARDLQAKSAEQIEGFALPDYVLLYPEYCWNNELAPLKRMDDEIHVVSIGTISLETRDSYDCCYLQLANRFIEKKIHFHIYPHWSYRDKYAYEYVNFKEDFADYIELAKNNKYFHIHESLSAEDLAKSLLNYDYGIVSGGCAEFGQRLKYYKPEYLKTCYSGRIADYLDAHLPVLINDDVAFNYWILKRNGVAVDLKGINDADFKSQLMRYKNDPDRKKQMSMAVKKFSNSSNAPRLANFYNKVAYSVRGSYSDSHYIFLSRMSKFFRQMIKKITYSHSR